MVVVHAGAAVNWDSIMLASSGTHFGGSIMECQPAWKGRVVCVGATGAELVVRDDLEDVRGAQLGSTALRAEGVVFGLESFGCA